MQPRILVREQGQNKKRFISPTQVKHNQVVYGNPLGVPKIPIHVQPTAMTSERMYSPQNRRSIIQLQRQQSQKHISSKIQQPYKTQSNAQRLRSNGQSSRHQPNTQSVKSTSKSKPSNSISKKDYMMSTLAKLNRQKTKQSDDESNGSQSRSKINSIKNQKQKKSSGTQQEYTKNVYNHKQKEVKRRPRNNDSRSQTSSVGSQEGFGIHGRIASDFHTSKLYLQGENNGKVGLGKIKSDMESRRSPQSQNSVKINPISQQSIPQTIRPSNKQPKPQQYTQSQSLLQKEKFSIRDNSQKHPQQIITKPQQYNPPLQPTSSKKQSNQERQSSQKPLLSPRQHTSHNQPIQFHQQKLSFTNPQQTRTFQRPQHSQIQDSNNSSLVIHLKKAHEQKQQLRQKKLIAQRQRNQLKQHLANQQQLVSQLRKQLQHIQVQNLSLNSQLKSIKQTQSRTRTQVSDTNQRNEHVYRDLHEKYQHLTEQYRKAIFENDSLMQNNELLKTDQINAQKKVKFLQSRVKQLEIIQQQKGHQHMQQIKQTVQEWKGNVQKLQKQLRKCHQQAQSPPNGSSLGNIKIKLIQYETELTHKSSLLQKRQDQLKSIKKQSSNKIHQLQQMLYKKDKQLKDSGQQISKHQKVFAQKSLQYQSHIKELQLKLAKVEKDLQIKRIQLQQSTKKPTNPTQNINSLYSGTQKLNKQSSQAKHSLQSIVSQQTSQVNHYKKQLNKSIGENFTLKSQIEQLKSLNNNLKQQVNILQLQYTTLQKKQSQSRQTQLYLMKSQLQTAMRKQKQLEQKLQWKAKQVKEKDQFIQAQLMRATNNNSQ